MIFDLIPTEFILFGITLAGIAFFHKKSTHIALGGMIIVLLYAKFVNQVDLTNHFIGTESHEGEWRVLLNLFGLLTGFSLLAAYFEQSELPQFISTKLSLQWYGHLNLLVLVFILSSFLDNIAAAMIGGSIAHVIYKGKVHVGFLAAIVAASNAGGAGSVIGDTTTTMMWIEEVPALKVIHAYIASAVAFIIFSLIAARQQHSYHTIILPDHKPDINFSKLFIVLLIITGTIVTNIYFDFPALGVWIAILIGNLFKKADWKQLGPATAGSVFLLSLVIIASLMPVESLPEPSFLSTFGLGVLSSVFDNIPLTKLALEQNNYDWGILAFAVGFGGSMLWFGSSAGVALSGLYPQMKNIKKWLQYGWHVALSYFIGILVLYMVMGWNPNEIISKRDSATINHQTK